MRPPILDTVVAKLVVRSGSGRHAAFPFSFRESDSLGLHSAALPGRPTDQRRATISQGTDRATARLSQVSTLILECFTSPKSSDFGAAEPSPELEKWMTPPAKKAENSAMDAAARVGRPFFLSLSLSLSWLASRNFPILSLSLSLSMPGERERANAQTVLHRPSCGAHFAGREARGPKNYFIPFVISASIKCPR